MKNINVVVIDNSYDVTKGIKKYFDNHSTIHVVRTFSNGEDAVSYLVKEETSYDLIIMDPIVPGTDGETILEELYRHQITKRVIVTSNSISSSLYSNEKKYNIIYFYKKPYSYQALERRINDFFQLKALLNSSNKNIELVVCNVLHELGIPSNLKGYDYLKEAILLKFNDKTIIYVTKDLYPRIAKTYKTKTENVERNIRHAIEVSCDRGNFDLMNELFKNSTLINRARPTNYEFISTITERLRMDCSFR